MDDDSLVATRKVGRRAAPHRPCGEGYMDKDKEREEISLIGRIFSLEALLVVMGLLSLISGIIRMERTQFILGVAVIAGAMLILIVRKKKRGEK
jgi:hypothetical protein